MASANFVLPPQQDQSPDSRLTTRFDAALKNTLWICMKRDPARQNFSLLLLEGLRSFLQSARCNSAIWDHGGRPMPIRYAVLKSEHPDNFSLGGDVRHFRACIEAQAWTALYDYSKLSLDVLYDWATVFKGRATTIALIQGRALGGGFEAALAADFVIAEEQGTFGFPEIVFGLFPATGGMFLLSQRVGVHRAERMMTNGRIYLAHELKEMGIVDEICPTGGGAAAVEKFILRHAKHLNARLMLQRARYRIAPLDYKELLTVIDEWVETTQQLSAEDLRVMEMLSLRQSGR